MAVSEQIVTTLVEAVAALNLRVNEALSMRMIPGEQGPKGDPGEDGRTPTDEEIRSIATEWLRANITQPADGEPGKDGQPGRDGRPPTDEEIQVAVDIWLELNRESLRGPAGEDGRDGDAGRDGRDGLDGRNGRDGDRGPAGVDGVGIALIEQRDEASFWITLTDGREFEIELPKPKRKGGGVIASGNIVPLYLSADDHQTQNALVNTATAMEFDHVIESQGITIEDNVRVVFGQSGLYNIQFSAQLHNSDSQDHDVSIWLARDGTAEPDSCTDITVPSKHGSFNGAAAAAWNFFYRAKKGEYFRLMWSTNSSQVYIAGLPERTAPVRPSTPSIILTVNRVSP